MFSNTTKTRRAFLQAAGTLGSLAWAGCASTGKIRTKIDDLYPSYIDAKTGAKVINLTPADRQDTIIYQTHPMWTPGMEYFVYMAAGVPQALEMATAQTRPLLDKSVNFSMQWDSANLYYFEGRDLYRLDVQSTFRGNVTKEKLGVLPEEYLQGPVGLSIDADGETVYTGAVLEQDKKWGIAAFNRGAWRTMTSFDFKVGHIQANPYRSGSVMFCWETGGDAPQRTWVVDDKEGVARPAYREINSEWVTHEAWWSRDRIIFTIWPYDDAHKRLPHGVAWSDLRNESLNVLAQYPAWHTQGSPDGHWALGDDFKRNLWLIDMRTQERRLLTQGHLGEGCKTHPHASFTPDSHAIVFNSSHFGNDDIFYVPLPQWESLPKLEEVASASGA